MKNFLTEHIVYVLCFWIENVKKSPPKNSAEGNVIYVENENLKKKYNSQNSFVWFTLTLLVVCFMQSHSFPPFVLCFLL